MSTKLIYITGAVIGRTVDQITEFELAKEMLAKHEFSNITTAIDDLPIADAFNNDDAQREWMKRRRQMLEDAEVVLWLAQFETDNSSLYEVAYAKTQLKEHKKSVVESVTDFLARFTSLPEKIS